MKISLYKNRIKLIISAKIILLSVVCNAQQLDYNILQSSGPIPNVIIKYNTYSNSNNINSNVLVNKLLNSGLVIFGDSITQYINDVADIALESEPELRESLNFFTYKTSEARIMALNNEIILVSIGLLTQLQNEDQLAYLICRTAEESRNKNQVTYGLSVSNNQMNKQFKDWDIRNYSNIRLTYSLKDNVDNDEKGLEIFKQTKYSLNEAVMAFDLLSNDYSCISKFNWKPNFIEDDYYKIPAKLWFDSIKVTETQNESIVEEETKNEDEDEEIEIEISDDNEKNILIPEEYNYYIERRDNLKLLLDESKIDNRKIEIKANSLFNNMLRMARNELLYCQIMETQFIKAYYNSLGLEKLYCSSSYIYTVRLLALNNMTSNNGKEHCRSNDKNTGLDDFKHLNYFFGNSTVKDIVIYTAREAHKAIKIYPKNDAIIELYKSSIHNLYSKTDLTFDNFISKKQIEIVQRIQTDRDSNSKYSKIRSKTKVKDDNTYYKYAFVNLLDDADFKSDFYEIGEVYNNKEADIEAKANIVFWNVNKWVNLRNKWKPSYNQIIVYENQRQFSNHGRAKELTKKELKRFQFFTPSLIEAASEHKKKLMLINQQNNNNNTIENWNANIILKCWLIERLNNDNFKIKSINNYFMKNVSVELGTPLISVINISHIKDKEELDDESIFYPINTIFKVHRVFWNIYETNIEVFIYNFEENKLEKKLLLENYGKPRKQTLLSWNYELLSQLIFTDKVK